MGINPNQQPYVVLECGCVAGSEFKIRVMGSFHDYVYCERHPDGDEYGQRILRDASVSEVLRFYYAGEKAAKRRSNGAHKPMLSLSGGNGSEAKGPRSNESALF